MEYIPPELVRDAASPDIAFHPPLGAPVKAPSVRTATCAVERDQFDSHHVMPADSTFLRRALRDWLPDGVLKLKVEGREFVATVTLDDTPKEFRGYTAAQLARLILDYIDERELLAACSHKKANQEAA